MYCDETNYLPMIQAMNVPKCYAPMVSMPAQELEMMYPSTYHVVYPSIQKQCDMIAGQMGASAIPNPNQMNWMVDNILNEVEPAVEAVINEESEPMGDRQLAFGGRRLLRDLIGILLLRELIGRRYPFYGYQPAVFGGYPGFAAPYPGIYSPGYGGYYGY